MRSRVLLAVACVLTAGAGITLVDSSATAQAHRGQAGACSPWVRIDGFSDALDKTVFDGVPVGELSAAHPDRNGRLLAVSDQSWLYTLDARTRQPVSVAPLADEEGRELDPEGIVVDRDGTMLVASETEPSVHRFTRSGAPAGLLPVPGELRVAPAGRAADNETFEGLALQPGGRTLVASMEGELAGDGVGIRRLQTWHRGRGADEFRVAAQYGYRADEGLDVSDIAAVGAERLLVLERGYTPDVGNTVRLYLADTQGASDVRGVENLTGQEEARLARKTLLADIADCPPLGATTKQPQPNPLLDNIEAVTVLDRDRHGRLDLLLVSDDNGRSTQTTRLYDLTVRLPRR